MDDATLEHEQQIEIEDVVSDDQITTYIESTEQLPESAQLL